MGRGTVGVSRGKSTWCVSLIRPRLLARVNPPPGTWTAPHEACSSWNNAVSGVAGNLCVFFFFFLGGGKSDVEPVEHMRGDGMGGLGESRCRPIHKNGNNHTCPPSDCDRQTVGSGQGEPMLKEEAL